MRSIKGTSLYTWANGYRAWASGGGVAGANALKKVKEVMSYRR